MGDITNDRKAIDKRYRDIPRFHALVNRMIELQTAFSMWEISEAINYSQRIMKDKKIRGTKGIRKMASKTASEKRRENIKIAATAVVIAAVLGAIYITQPPVPPENIIIDDPADDRTFIRSIEVRETINPGDRDERNYSTKYSEYKDENGNIFLELDKGG